MIARPSAAALSPAPETILVFTSSDLVGDGLIKYPFVKALRHAFPTAHITWATGNGESEYAGTLRPLVAGLIDEVVSNARLGLSWPQALTETPLAGRAFDLVLDIQRRVVASFHIRRVSHRIFVSGALGFLLSDRRPAGLIESLFRKPERFIDQLLRLIPLVAGVPADTSGAPPLDPAMRDAAALLIPGDARALGFAIGARGVHKCWPQARFIDLARRTAARGYTPVFFLGPMEAGAAPEIAAAVPAAHFPLQHDRALAFGASPLFTIALAERVLASVANDSGTGHMLALGGRPLVSLFGPTPPGKFAPAATRLAVIRAQDYGGDAMARIPVEAVEAALLDLVAP